MYHRGSHAVLMALRGRLGYLTAADHNGFGPVCQRDRLPRNSIWGNKKTKKTAGGDGRVHSLWEEFARKPLATAETFSLNSVGFAYYYLNDKAGIKKTHPSSNTHSV